MIEPRRAVPTVFSMVRPPAVAPTVPTVADLDRAARREPFAVLGVVAYWLGRGALEEDQRDRA
jgi:hypothetical protein